MTQPSITIILPTYQEVESLPSLIKAIQEVREGSYAALQLLIVDDNSADGTEELIDGLALPWVRLLVRKQDRGLSSAVLHGLDTADSEICIVMDADGSHPASTIPSIVQAIENGADFVVGSRYIEGGETEDGWGVLRWLNSKIATLMARPFTKVLDPMSGFLGFRRSTYLQATDINPVGYKIGLELIVKCHCNNVVEVPIHFRTRRLGQSKLTLRVQWEYLQHVIRLLRYTHPKLVSFFTFATVGLSGMFVYNASLIGTKNLISDRYLWIAIALAAWIAMTWNFLWDRKYAFWYSRNHGIFYQYIGFVCVCAVSLTATIYITYLMAQSQTILLSGIVGSATGSLIGILFNFFVSRLLVFGK